MVKKKTYDQNPLLMGGPGFHPAPDHLGEKEAVMAHTQGHGGRGNPENLDPQFPELAKALKGIDLPVDKNGIHRFIEEHGAPEDVLVLIDDLPDREYHTMADIMHGAAGKTAKADGDATKH